MAFEAFPREAVEAYKDTGYLYIQEHGQLRSLHGLETKCIPPVRRLGPHLDENIETFLPNKLTYDIEACTHKVPKLLNLCIDFVAENVHLLDSLVGFPEIVGKSLFDAVDQHSKFARLTIENFHSFCVFLQAYGSIVLSAINLENCDMFVTRTLIEYPSLFLTVNKLDLSGCKLGWHSLHLSALAHLIDNDRSVYKK